MAAGSNAPGGQRTTDAPPRPSLDGRTQLGKYEIGRLLGAGGMGTVYLAVDSQLKRTIALKVLPKERTENEILVRRFEAEAQAAAQLKHENIVTIYDAGRIDGHLFIALEFVEGTDIYDLVARRGALPLKRSVNFVKQITRALEHLHKRGFVHRDIKPSNILVTREGTVKLTDMGLARAVDESLKSNITREGTTVGTVDYMAPEQARDSQAADIRSDIYSLGCTWYQMLTGEPPFPNGSVTNKLYAHASKPRPDPRALNRSVPEEVVIILHRMMARKPADRYQSPADILEDIENLGAGNKRIEELLGPDTDDSSAVAATPAFGTPLPLPPRHLPNRSTPAPDRPAPDGPAERSAPEPLPRLNRLPARRGGTQSEPTPPSQAPPPAKPAGRHAKSQSDSTPAPTPTPTPAAARLPGRQLPAPARDATPRSGFRFRRPKSEADDPAPAGPAPARAQPNRDEEAPASSDRPAVHRPAGHNEPESGQPPDADHSGGHRTANRERSASSRRVAVNERAEHERTPARGQTPVHGQAAVRAQPAVRERAVGEEPVEGGGMAGVDWKPIAIKAAGIVGGVIALGACIWLLISWQSSSSDHGTSKSPWEAQAATLPDEAEKEEAKKADKAAAKKKTPAKKQSVVAELKKPASDTKPFDPSTVVGRPEERKLFPPWIGELWTPQSPNSTGTNAKLKTLFVGRVGNERASSPSLAVAIEELPAEGGIIELRGPGPFLLPATKIANRKRVIITGVSAQSSGASGPVAGGGQRPGADLEGAPLIVIVPTSGPRGDSALLAIETSLTLYGVHLAVFADQFPGDRPLRLIDARSADVALQKCSVTLVGSRSGQTIAVALSAPFSSAGSRPARVLLDRTFIRGKDLTAIQADLPAIDLLAINSLFVTGKAPVLGLTGSTFSAASPAEGTVPRMLRFFSSTTCTEEEAVSMRLGAGAARPPATRIQVVNSVFGTVFRPQGAAMIALNDWPSHSTGPNHVAFDNLVWATTAFVARGWQTLVQSDTSPPLGTKDAGDWAAFWGEPASRIDYEPASFAPLSQIATVDPGQFKWDVMGQRPAGGGDSFPPGCDVGLLAVASADAFARADALARRPKVPAIVDEPATVKEIDLDNPNHRELENLSRFINRTDWKSGTRFRVRGTNTKSCGPIRVTGRSLSIEFVDPAPLITFEDARGDTQHSAFITVSGGSIEIIHANFRVKPAAKRLPHWLLDVKEGNFAIRGSSLEGPSFEKPGYEGLIHFSPPRLPAGATKSEQAAVGEIRDSFLRTSKTAVSGDIRSRNLILQNSILAANGRVFDLHGFQGASGGPTLDLTACTLASGEEYFHLDPGSAAQAKGTGRVRIYAEDTVFSPPLAAKSADRPVLIGGLSPAAVANSIDWWEYGSAYSNLISLPASASDGGSRRDPLADWKETAGRTHIVRSIDDPNAVLFPRDLPAAKDLLQDDFHLKPEAEAATWADMGGPVGAVLAAQPAASGPMGTPLKTKPAGSRKTAPGKKTPVQPQSGF